MRSGLPPAVISSVGADSVGGSQAGVAGGDRGVQGFGEGFVLGRQFLDTPGKGSQRGQDRGVEGVSGRPLPGQGISPVR
ncbi:hypothetical protein [Streptomyces sp. NPDC006996]|uniref:hypothetical protein n=1 Tax=Streptomyces sp. NPDC006996 TaxID=3156908 RepID=UPI0033CD244F